MDNQKHINIQQYVKSLEKQLNQIAKNNVKLSDSNKKLRKQLTEMWNYFTLESEKIENLLIKEDMFK